MSVNGGTMVLKPAEGLLIDFPDGFIFIFSQCCLIHRNLNKRRKCPLVAFQRLTLVEINILFAHTLMLWRTTPYVIFIKRQTWFFVIFVVLFCVVICFFFFFFLHCVVSLFSAILPASRQLVSCWDILLWGAQFLSDGTWPLRLFSYITERAKIPH